MKEGFTVIGLQPDLNAGYWSTAPGTTIGWGDGVTQGAFYDFWWITHGRLIVRVHGKPYEGVGPKDIFLLRPGQTMKWEFDPLEPTSGYLIRFTTSPLPDKWPKPDLWPVKREMPADDIIRPLFEYVTKHLPTAEEGVPEPVSIAIETMMTAFIDGPVERSHVLPRAYPVSVRRVLQWLRELMNSGPARKVTLEDLAAVGGVSSTHLGRLFRKHLGCTALELLFRYRVTQSLMGIRSGQKIESLAHELGFYNATHFALRFRAVFGKTPTQMQHAMAKGYVPEIPQLF